MLAAEGDLLSEGRVIKMPSLIILENVFKKVMVTMNAWANMAMDKDFKEGGVDGLNCVTVLNHFKTRRQVNMGAEPKLPNFSQMVELK